MILVSDLQKEVSLLETVFNYLLISYHHPKRRRTDLNSQLSRCRACRKSIIAHVCDPFTFKRRKHHKNSEYFICPSSSLCVCTINNAGLQRAISYTHTHSEKEREIRDLCKDPFCPVCQWTTEPPSDVRLSTSSIFFFLKPNN